MKRLLLVAYNIHQGGGKVLLEGLVSKLIENSQLTILVDERNTSHFPDQCTIIRIKPRLTHRIKAELMIFRQQNSFDEALFFGNLPPLFDFKIPTRVYLQNKFLLKPPAFDFTKIAVRLALEEIWLKTRLKKHYTVEVQGKSMKNSFLEKFPNHENILINFFHKKREVKNLPPENRSGFFYPADFSWHKNHKILLESWIILSQRGLYPELFLTISQNELKEKHPSLVNHLSNLKIFFIGNLNEEELINHYQKSKALIYPSLIESLGLPLIEAKDFDLEIICSDLDFVHDHIIPTATFDPLSPISIANAIEQYLKKG